MTIALYGLGKLGLPLAALLARDSGQPVIGVDVNADVVRAVNRRECLIFEPGLEELLSGLTTEQLSATTDGEYAATIASTIIVLVPTPSDDSGRFSNRYVMEAIGAIGAGIRSCASRFYDPLVAIVSTVMPGSMAQLKIELRNASRGAKFHLIYNPEFVALGSVIEGTCEPDSLLIGVDPSYLRELEVGGCQ